MSRLPFSYSIITVLSCAASLAIETHAAENALAQIDRTILKEPAYQSTPRYSLLALGDAAKVKVWMVEDGKRLFVDKNANGDLTDDGAPLEPKDFRTFNSTQWDFHYALDAITPADGTRTTDFRLSRWNYGIEDTKNGDSYGLSLTVDGKLPMYAGWFGTFWSAKPETAQVIHFGGAFKPTMLRGSEFVIGSGPRRLSLGFMNSGSGPGATSRLSIEAPSKELIPILNIDWPVADGTAPLCTSHQLTERCCYWEFYTTKFQVPAGVVVGKAKVSLEFTGGTLPIKLTTTEIKVPVVTESKGTE